MARNFFELERGLKITSENSDTGIHVIFGSAAPDGVSGDQGVAAIGSLYILNDENAPPAIYQKVANAGAPADYIKQATTSGILSLAWRSEKVVALTNETLSVGVKDATTFSDDDAPTLTGADFTANVSYVIGGAGSTPVLYKVTAVAGDNITLALADEALAENDTFVVKNYLPDAPDAQEKQAIVNYNGSVIVKISDINWAVADAISLAASYVAGSGNVTSSDTVDSAIRKLDGNVDAINTSLGTAQGATELGSFTGVTIPDDSSVKGALQSLETALEAIPVSTVTSFSPIGSITAWDKYGNGTPLVLPNGYEECNGQIITDVESPYLSKRIRNLNGKTLIGITVAAVDDLAKTFTISLNDVSAFSVGDTLSFTTTSVPDAVVKSVNYGTGEITVGNFSSWTSGSFDLTGYSLAGADTVSVSGQPRFLRGSDSEGSDVNQLQGHWHSNNMYVLSSVVGGDSQYSNGGTRSSETNPVTDPASDGTNGTPRTGQKTQPDLQNIVWVMRIK